MMTPSARSHMIAWRNRGAMLDFRGRHVFHVRGPGRRAADARRPAVLCVHGYPTSSWDWFKIWPALVAEYDVIAADMLGFGFSAKPLRHDYSISEQADLQEAVLAQCGVREFHLLCHDYGDTVGQELLARHAAGMLPGLQSVVFLNGGLMPEAHRPRPLQRLLATPIGPLVALLANERTFGRSMRQIFSQGSPPTRDEVAVMWALASRDFGALALQGLIRYMEERRRFRARWVSAVVDTDLPLFVINGAHDPVSGSHMVDRLLELRSSTDILSLQVGHYPQLEAPESVSEAYLSFLRGVA